MAKGGRPRKIKSVRQFEEWAEACFRECEAEELTYSFFFNQRFPKCPRIQSARELPLRSSLPSFETKAWRVQPSAASFPSAARNTRHRNVTLTFVTSVMQVSISISSS